jgi:hypothetical protein
MKRYCLLPVLAVFLAACSSPVLDWIETPAETQTQPVLMSDKAITGFTFGIPGETDVIQAVPHSRADGKIPITVVLPQGKAKNNLSPSDITFIGKSVTPLSDGTDFSSPVTYRVYAWDGSYQDYEVEVLVKNPQSAEIVWFDLELPGGGSLMAKGTVVEGSDGQPGDIILHVPSETDLGKPLTAKIVQTGTIEGPGVTVENSGATTVTLSGDFSEPQIYTVTAEDTSQKSYTVMVFKDKSNVKEITEFSFGEFGGAVLIAAEPQYNGKYPVVAMVPGSPSASLSSLAFTVAYKGAEIEGPSVQHSRTTDFSVPVSLSGQGQDFSVPVTYRVTAEDGTSREYEVTVMSDLDAKQITGFYFSFPAAQGMQGPAGIIDEAAKTIAVTVPAGTDLRSLAPAIYHTGASISPISGEPRDFTGPVRYTVTARNDTTAVYTVSVFVAKKSDKAITALDFDEVSGETVVIGGAPGAGGQIPIVVTVPHKADLDPAALTPALTFTGKTISGPAILKTNSHQDTAVPDTATADGTVDFTTDSPTYTVTAEDGSAQAYSVTVVKTADPGLDGTSDLASIDGFYFNNPMAAGVIDQDNQTIAVTVPYGTDVTNLIPTIYFTGNTVATGSVADTGHAPTTEQVGSVTVTKPFMSSPAFIAANFTAPVQYTVTPLSQKPEHAKTYTVTVTRGAEPPASDVRAITFFTFKGVSDTGTTAAISTVPDASGKYPVEVIVPDKDEEGKSIELGLLTPIILYKGASIDGPGKGTDWAIKKISPDPEITGVVGSTTANFTDPQTYTVTAANGGSSQYIVTVRVDDNHVKEITDFRFSNPVAIGVIDQDAKTITVTVPSGTNLSSLSPIVYYKGVSLDPVSGRAVDFSSPVTYTVTARDGTVQPYRVRVIPKLSAAKEITAVSFLKAGVIETVIGSLPSAGGLIPVSITVSAQTDIRALSPVITHTGVSIIPPGGAPQTDKPFTDGARDFRVPQVYTVTAEDGSVKDYAVSVHAAGEGAKSITGFVFKSVQVGSGIVSVVGQINQETHTIEVRVPLAAATLTLAPTITYLGAELKYKEGTDSQTTSQVDKNTKPTGQSDTFTDGPRNFELSLDRYYVVEAVDGSTLEYTVKVSKIPEVTVRYESLKDDKFITDSFDQLAGLLTVTIDTSGGTKYEAPYAWYVNGVQQNVSTSQSTLVIKTADFKPGEHQVTVSATKKADGKHYTNIVYFLVRE